MSTVISSVKVKIKRIPWGVYLKKQLYKLLGFLGLGILIIGIMVVSSEINLETATSADPLYLIAVALSSICFILVLIGFSKIILFDMGNEFGLRNDENNTVYNARFFLFAALALSFCSAIYLLLDVFLQATYLELLPVLMMEWVLIAFDIQIAGLTDIGSGREFYQTARNIYFAFFFLIIIGFSVLVFLSILTTLGRKRVVSRYKKDETEQTQEEENKRFYKIFAWLAIPLIEIFLGSLFSSEIGFIISVIFLILLIWWVYQLFKIIILVVWRGFKITAFITSVNALLLIPLILVLYGAPVIAWMGWDVIQLLQQGAIDLTLPNLITAGFESLSYRYQDILSIIQLDFIFITLVATCIVGFAEGFAIVAIFTAIFKGVEVARTGQIITHSPPKIAVISKYLIMLVAWLGLSWNSFLEIWNLLIEKFNFHLPPIVIPSFFYLIYNSLILPLSTWFEQIIPILKFVPFLLLPLYFILSGAFKFLSVTIITPRVKNRLSIFFLLVSTSFVLIITNILGDIYELGASVIPDAPLISVFELSYILTEAVFAFEYFEAITFYTGFLFGLAWVIRRGIQAIQMRSRSPVIPFDGHLTESDLQLSSGPSKETNKVQTESNKSEISHESSTEEE